MFVFVERSLTSTGHMGQVCHAQPITLDLPYNSNKHTSCIYLYKPAITTEYSTSFATVVYKSFAYMLYTTESKMHPLWPLFP